MRLILLFILLHVSTSLHCIDKKISDMDLHVCDVPYKSKDVYFHDFTGENHVKLKNGKIYRNHGEFVALYKEKLYVSTKKYELKDWVRLKNEV